MNTPVRRCNSCHRLLPETPEYFNRNAHSRGGLLSICRECRKARRNQEYQDRPEIRAQAQARTRRNYWRNPDRRRELARQYAADHSEEAVSRVRRWREQNPDRYRQHNAYSELRHDRERARRARELGATGTHTLKDIQAQYNAQNGLCFWCSVPLPDSYHVDHVVPLSRHGSDGPENLVAACPSCNLSKGTKLPYLEWEPPNPLL